MPASPFLEKRVRVLFFLQKNDGKTFEEWSHYWSHNHAQIFSSLDIVKKNILRYEELHVNQEWKEKLVQSGKVKVPNFDGIAVLEAESLEKIVEVVQHPDWTEKVIADGKTLFNLEAMDTGGFDIAVIFDKSSKSKSEVGSNIRKDVGRLVVPLRKKDGLGQSEFNHHWLNVHAPLFKSLVGDSSISKYEQLHGHEGPLGTSKQWDGLGVIEGESIGKLFEVKKKKMLLSSGSRADFYF
ncbi:hypothetical protein L218DRAFT_503674 [Marasmius fiardii PR-910]|nr:hypothetical protein L218DRAFT_503674 [Marasmius fiardii PR-910]